MKTFHEIANIFPLMSESEFNDLVKDISEKGLIEPIWLHPDGRIIDGRNRYKACIQAGVELKFRTWDGNGSLVSFVMSLNLHRRHLSSMQKAAVAVEILPFLEAEAKERQIRTAENRAKAEDKKNLVVQKIVPQEKKVDTKSSDQAAEMTGTNRQYVSDMKKYKEETPDVYEAAKAGLINGSEAKLLHKETPEVRKQIVEKVTKEPATSDVKQEVKSIKIAERKAEIQKQKEAIENQEIQKPSGLFDVIVVDPPWAYGREYDPETSRVANPYPEMPQTELLELQIPCSNNCIIFLWTTHAFLWDAKALLDKWGFQYKACLVWDKEKIGMGAWVRMQCEFCLVAIKGKPLWDNTTWRDIIREPRREHSRKPEKFYEFVESVTAGRRLDFFSREQREGWSTYGNDTNRF